mgnify:CR=1 FL=1
MPDQNPAAPPRFQPLAPFERDTLNRIFWYGVEHHAAREALRHRQDGAWQAASFAEAGARVTRLAAALELLGVRSGDRVALLSENRPEWALGDYAVLALGAVTVPIYPTLPADQVRHILADSGAAVVLASTPEQVEKLRGVRDTLPALRHVVGFDGADGPEVPRLTTLLERIAPPAGWAAALRERAFAVAPEALATLIYTSGTTGVPKGVMLTHRNLAVMVAATAQHGAFELEPGDVALSLLPLSHVLERAACYFYWERGVATAYAESIEQVAENLREVRPHTMTAVPRLFEKIYLRVTGTPGVKGRIARWAAGVAQPVTEARLAGRALPPTLALQHHLADRLVYAKLRAATGGRVRMFISGGAPLTPEVGRFFYAAGLRIHEGYGLTETAPVLAANRPGETRFGTVGVPYPGVELRLAGNGEILARGPSVMQGYWQQPEASAAALEPDGWLHTGDVGAFDADGFLRITDRIKDLIVTANGKNIAPQPIENRVALSPYVAQALMFGDRRPYPVMLVVPDWEALKQWAVEHGIELADRLRAARDAQLQAFLEGEVLGRLHGLARFERPKKLAIIPEALSIESGMLTPTLKVKRRAAEQRYRELIEALYSAPAPAAT